MRKSLSSLSYFTKVLFILTQFLSDLTFLKKISDVFFSFFQTNPTLFFFLCPLRTITSLLRRKKKKKILSDYWELLGSSHFQKLSLRHLRDDELDYSIYPLYLMLLSFYFFCFICFSISLFLVINRITRCRMNVTFTSIRLNKRRLLVVIFRLLTVSII